MVAKKTDIMEAPIPKRKLLRINSKNLSSTVSRHVCKDQNESCPAGNKNPRNIGIAQTVNANQDLYPCR